MTYRYPQCARPHRLLPWFIAAMPAYTGGFLAPVPFLYLAARMRLRKYWLIATAWCALWLVPWVVLAAIGPLDHGLSRLSHRLVLVLAIGATVHAFALSRSLPRYRAPAPTRPPQPAPPSAVPSDPAQAMRAEVQTGLAGLRASIARHAGLLPDACQQLLAEIVEHTAQVVEFLARGGQADAELRSVHAIITDYLPTSINTYVRLPREYALTQRNSSGRTAAEELELELRLLRDKVGEAADALHHIDAVRLAEHSAFLQAKFAPSELDMP